jgi:hypothetical protein
MDEHAKSAPVPLGGSLALIVAAVILAEGIWAMLVSVTRSLLLPLVARITGGDSQSALYLGKGDVNVPDLFGSVLQLCLAGILFLIIKSWASKGTRVKTVRVVKSSKPVSPISIAAQPVVPTAQAAVAQPVTPTAQAAAATAVPVSQPQAPAAAPPEAMQPSVRPQTAKLAKPKKPQEVYYNIVGEPITPEDE